MAEGGLLCPPVPVLHDDVLVGVGEDIIKGVEMDEVIWLLAVDAGEIGIPVFGVGGDLHITAVSSKQPVAVIVPCLPIQIRGSLEQFLKGTPLYLCPLLEVG